MAVNRADLEPMSPEIKFFKILEWKCLAEIKAFLKQTHSNFFSVIDARKVFSIEQMQICHERAQRIMQTSDRIKRPESAFLMLLSGENQISRAQEEIGISSSTESIFVVYDNTADFASFLKFCGDWLEEMAKIPTPYRNQERDSIIFSRMARVQLSL